MPKPTRLFDCLNYQLHHFPKPDMLNAKEQGQWKNYSTQYAKDISAKLAAGLLQLGVGGNDMGAEGSDKIAIISSNRPEWIFTDLAVQQTGAILIPLYPTTNPLEIEFILNDAQVKYIFTGNAEMYEKIKALQPNVPSLKDIFSFDEVPGAKSWNDVLALATATSLKEIETIASKIDEEQLATIIYTSGTTGTPKGVMLSHKNIISNIFMSKESFPFYDDPNTKVLSFLPLNHIFEKTCTYIYLFSGNSIFYAESLETIGDNLKEVKPHGFTTVPRLLEKVYEKIMAKGKDLKGIKRKLFYWAVALGERYDNNKKMGWWYNFQLSIANKLIFSKWREALGGNIQFIITGGAAASEKLLRIFNAGQVPVYEGYGPTENSPVICVNRRNHTVLGTVGPPINGLEVKLDADGEIIVKGPSVMVGYYKRPDLTAECVIDGWLHTGDIGTFNNGVIKITDRKKELFKTSGGKYVAPQPIENKLKESLLIEQVIIIGAGRKFVAALIVPSFAALKDWMGKNGLVYTTNQQAIEQPKVKELFAKTIEEYNVVFNHVEQVKRFALLPKEWTIEGGEMTPKMSLKRKVIMEKYEKEIEKIYACED